MKSKNIYLMPVMFIVGLLWVQPVLASVENNVNESVRRIALFTASNDGGEGRMRLRYAESDALSISKVFEELGGLSPADNTILLSPTKKRFQNTLIDLAQRLNGQKNESERTEFIFYYSGHSDGEGLMLRDGKMSYRELRDSLKEIKSDVQIAILDSCQSGVFTRLKGGKRVTPFLMNAANRVSGNIFLSASSESEAAQESDEIGASFFTHHFVSALRGASDVSNDKQVTLNEAYQYAFNQTLENTENSQAGAQHPAYNFQIAGAGDLVLTDIKLASSSLVVPPDILGRIYVRDIRGGLVLELNKAQNKSLTIALEPGKYSIVLEANPELFQSDIKMISGESLVLSYPNFKKLKIAKNRSRGSELASVYRQKKHKRKYSFSAGTISSWLYLDARNYQMYGYEYVNKFPDFNKRYDGYELLLSSSVDDNSDLYFSYFNSRGWGKYEGISFLFKFGLYQKKVAKNEYVKLYMGGGLFAEKLTGFSGDLQNNYGDNIVKLRKSGVWGAQFPIGVMFVKNGFSISGEVKSKFGSNTDSVYENNSRLNAFSLNMGYRL